jgi:hypothetical protein
MLGVLWIDPECWTAGMDVSLKCAVQLHATVAAAARFTVLALMSSLGKLALVNWTYEHVCQSPARGRGDAV